MKRGFFEEKPHFIFFFVLLGLVWENRGRRKTPHARGQRKGPARGKRQEARYPRAATRRGQQKRPRDAREPSSARREPHSRTPRDSRRTQPDGSAERRATGRRSVVCPGAGRRLFRSLPKTGRILSGHCPAPSLILSGSFFVGCRLPAGVARAT